MVVKEFHMTCATGGGGDGEFSYEFHYLSYSSFYITLQWWSYWNICLFFCILLPFSMSRPWNTIKMADDVCVYVCLYLS